ncbi:MAG: tetratricopeptide repeat protein, partial [Acidobacteriaceae bacterium]|nr:tetratricopeptide repeat protein [Acidobacteriaceae bacterium]
MILGLVLVLVTLVLYNPAGRYPFINYDDDHYVSENSQIQQGVSWHSIVWAFTSTSEANWHPLTWLSHEIDWQLFHENPSGYHYGNVLFHAANACLLFFVLLQATGFLWRSWIVAALFDLHPINVESVAWISERKNLLSMFFFLLALAAYRWYAQKPSVKRYTSVAACFALGLMAKPQVITLPFLLLLWDHWPLGRTRADGGDNSASQASAMPSFSWPQLILEKVPLFVLAAASAVVTVKVQTAAGAVRDFHQLSFIVRLGNAALSYFRYIEKAFWPSHLAVLYPYSAFSGLQVAAALSFVLLISAAVIATRRRYLLVGWLWFLGALVPMIGLVQAGAQSMADRYAYLPFIGLFLMACWGFAEIANFQRWRVAIPIALCSAALVGLAMTTRHQLGYWRDSVTLWSHAVEVTGPNFQAQEHFASALSEDGRPQDAGPHFEAALAIDPTNPKGNLNLAVYDQTHGKIDAAIPLYQNTLQLTSDVKLEGEALGNLGWAYYQLGKLQEAESTYKDAVRVTPENHNTWIGMGLVENRMRKCDESADAFSHAGALSSSAVDYLLMESAL